MGLAESGGTRRPVRIWDFVRTGNVYTKRALSGVAALLLIGVMVWAAKATHQANEARVVRQKRYRIGADQSPPYSVIDAGPLHGMNVDVLNEAARRAGLRLDWVGVHTSADQALAAREVDLWPAGGYTPWRQEHLYFTEPWLQNSFALVSIESHPVNEVSDLSKDRRLAFRGGGLMDILTKRDFPPESLLRLDTREGALSAVCDGRAAAAAIESRSLQLMLRHRPEGCAQADLAVREIRLESYRLSILAQPEAAGAARMMREAIGDMTRDGTLLEIEARWEPVGSAADRELFARMQADRVNRWTQWGLLTLAGFAAMMGGLVTVSVGALRRARRAERESRESRSRLEMLGDNLPGGVVLQAVARPDEFPRFLYVSRGIEEITGMKAANVLEDSRCILDLVVPSDIPALNTGWQATLRDLENFKGEFRFEKSPGEFRWARVACAPRRQVDGSVILDGVMIDITDRKVMEAELRDERDHAHAGTRAKSMFLATMSHEIRTPLNGVIGLTSLLLDSELNDEQRRYAEIVRSSGETLLSLINNILDFSKIEAEKVQLDVTDFDLEALLDDVASNFAVRAHEKGIHLVASVAPGVPRWLRGDGGRLRQVVYNLTGNAIKFTEVGEVVVRVEAERRGEQEVVLRTTVRDTGIGIPAEKMSVLFERFSQVDPSNTRKYGGSGLGLAISKRLANLLGGDIGVSSEGSGSEFWFTAVMAASGATAREAPLAADGSEPLRVLAVEPHEATREVLVEYLEGWGLRVLPAANVRDAMLASARKPGGADLVVLDADALTGQPQALDNFAGMPAVLLERLGSPGVRKLAHSAALERASKPLRKQELRESLRRLIAPAGAAVVDAPEVVRTVAAPAVRMPTSRRARVLVVEDNPVNQKVALGILSKLGVDAETVGNGEEALEALSIVGYDLVFMDLEMPVMDGFEATRRIRHPESNVRDHGVPIIAMTAHALRADQKLCFEIGMNDFITKPVSSQVTAEALMRWLPRPGESVVQRMTIQ